MKDVQWATILEQTQAKEIADLRGQLADRDKYNEQFKAALGIIGERVWNGIGLLTVAKAVTRELAEARKERDTMLKRVRDAHTKINNYCLAHQNVIDASWVAKVIDQAETALKNYAAKE